MSTFEHMDLLTKTYSKSIAFLLWSSLGILKDIRRVSFGDTWALAEALIAIKWGYK